MGSGDTPADTIPSQLRLSPVLAWLILTPQQRKGTSPMCSPDTRTHPAGNALTSLRSSLGCSVVPILGIGGGPLFPVLLGCQLKGPGSPFLSTQPHQTGPDRLEVVEMSSQAHFAQSHLRFLSDLSHGCIHPTAEPKTPKGHPGRTPHQHWACPQHFSHFFSRPRLALEVVHSYSTHSRDSYPRLEKGKLLQ